MIVGVGIDVVNIPRFAATLERTPALAERLFTPTEQHYPLRSLAARFAAKEALAKALGAPGNLNWQDACIVRAPGQAPELHVHGTVLARAKTLGVGSFHLSLSHDDPVATAIVIAHSEPLLNRSAEEN